MKKNLGRFLILIGVILILVIIYENSYRKQVPIVFSPKFMLSELWNSYKNNYIEPGSGRTLDKQKDNITTSEGEGYTMLRAVWMDDKATFDQSWNFTQNNLKRPTDNLFSWLYGKKSDGTFGILSDQGGGNSASDADTDIALSLVFAYSRWGDTKYLAAAQNIMSDIWNLEVVFANGKPYLTADNVEKVNKSNLAIVDPSYFSPYAYRIFSQYDKGHDWMGLVDTSYSVIQESTQNPLDKKTSVGLPPDWVLINKNNGTLKAPTVSTLTTNYSFDALRVPWRIAMDWEWYKEPRAKQTLDKMAFLSAQWQKNKIIYAGYTHDGQVVDNFEAPAMYGGTLGYFMVSDPAEAADYYNIKLASLYNPDSYSWKNPLSYYDDNWAWFGIGLYYGMLPNLGTPSQGINPSVPVQS